jgi:hypothetical protein
VGRVRPPVVRLRFRPTNRLLACLAFATAREVYPSLAWGLCDYRLGNWAWRRDVPGLGLATVNPRLAAGAFRAALDTLVVTAASLLGRQSPARPSLTPSTPSHQAATCSVRSSSR